jgi:hypothetical protein
MVISHEEQQNRTTNDLDFEPDKRAKLEASSLGGSYAVWAWALAVLPDERVVSGSADRSVQVRRRTIEIQNSFSADSPVTCLSVNFAGVIAAGCQDGTAHLLSHITAQTDVRGSVHRQAPRSSSP